MMYFFIKMIMIYIWTQRQNSYMTPPPKKAKPYKNTPKQKKHSVDFYSNFFC